MKKSALIAENQELRKTLDMLIYQPTSVDSLVYLMERSLVDQVVNISWGVTSCADKPTLSDVITFYIEKAPK